MSDCDYYPISFLCFYSYISLDVFLKFLKTRFVTLWFVNNFFFFFLTCNHVTPQPDQVKLSDENKS